MSKDKKDKEKVYYFMADDRLEGPMTEADYFRRLDEEERKDVRKVVRHNRRNVVSKDR